MTNTLYRVDNYETTPVWNDITPAGDYVPMYPYALAVDVLTDGRAMMVADDGTDQHLFATSDNGDNWADAGETENDYRGIKVAGDIIGVFGVSSILLSVDGGSTSESKVGDWSVSISSLGTFRGLWIAV